MAGSEVVAEVLVLGSIRRDASTSHTGERAPSTLVSAKGCVAEADVPEVKRRVTLVPSVIGNGIQLPLRHHCVSCRIDYLHLGAEPKRISRAGLVIVGVENRYRKRRIDALQIKQHVADSGHTPLSGGRITVALGIRSRIEGAELRVATPTALPAQDVLITEQIHRILERKRPYDVGRAASNRTHIDIYGAGPGTEVVSPERARGD